MYARFLARGVSEACFRGLIVLEEILNLASDVGVVVILAVAYKSGHYMGFIRRQEDVNVPYSNSHCCLLSAANCAITQLPQYSTGYRTRSGTLLLYANGSENLYCSVQ